MESIKLTLKLHGIHEWLLVRFSAIVVLLYLIYLFGFMFLGPSLSYNDWYNFFSNKSTKVLSILTLFSTLSHTWIGMRHIVEDYIKKYILKKLGIWLIIIMLFSYLLFGIIIIWSV